MRILVVEDEPTLATQLAEGIQSVGYVVDVAHNGVDGSQEMAYGRSYFTGVDPDGTRYLAGESGRHRCRCG